MFAKSLIAAAAITVAAAGMASTAEAKVHFDVNVGVPGIYVGHGYYPGYYPVYDDGYSDGYYDEDCGWKKVKKVKWHNGHKHVVIKKKWVCY